jgi:hypothetical protein
MPIRARENTEPRLARLTVTLRRLDRAAAAAPERVFFLTGALRKPCYASALLRDSAGKRR